MYSKNTSVSGTQSWQIRTKVVSGSVRRRYVAWWPTQDRLCILWVKNQGRSEIACCKKHLRLFILLLKDSAMCCMHVYMCVCRCAHPHQHVWSHWDVFFNYSPPYFLRQGFSLTLLLAGQQAPWIDPSLPLALDFPMHALMPGFLPGCKGSELKSSCARTSPTQPCPSPEQLI